MDKIIEIFSNIGMFSFFGACITVIGGFIAWRHKRFITASDAFRAAFAPEISTLNGPVFTDDVRSILISAFSRHNEAFTVFQRYVSSSSKYYFNKEWQQYHSGHSFDAEGYGISVEERLFMEYFSFDSQPEAAEYALNKINNLLLFAE